MPGSNIEAHIAALEQLINESKSSFMGAGLRKIIDADRAYAILDEIKQSLPEEFAKARRVLRERDEILDSAGVEADRMIDDARATSELLASETEVMRIATNEAESTRLAAEEQARSIRFWAEDAAEKTLANVEEQLRAVMGQTGELLTKITYYRDLFSGHDAEADDAGMDDQAYAQ